MCTAALGARSHAHTLTHALAHMFTRSLMHPSIRLSIHSFPVFTEDPLGPRPCTGPRRPHEGAGRGAPEPVGVAMQWQSQRLRACSWPGPGEASGDPAEDGGGAGGGKGGGEWNAGTRATGRAGGRGRCEWRWPGAGAVAGKVTVEARQALWECSLVQTHGRGRRNLGKALSSVRRAERDGPEGCPGQLGGPRAQGCACLGEP